MRHTTTYVPTPGDDETHILEEAAETVYERPNQHGEPEDSFGKIAQMWSAFLGAEITPSDVANMMILLKVSRNAEGHYTEDNYTDIAGYSENGARLHNNE